MDSNIFQLECMQIRTSTRLRYSFLNQAKLSSEVECRVLIEKAKVILKKKDNGLIQKSLPVAYG